MNIGCAVKQKQRLKQVKRQWMQKEKDSKSFKFNLILTIMNWKKIITSKDKRLDQIHYEYIFFKFRS